MWVCVVCSVDVCWLGYRSTDSAPLWVIALRGSKLRGVGTPILVPLRSVPRAGSNTRTESDVRFSEGENLISWLTKLYWLILTSESLN